jgi:ABC-2 type transport system permease protein
MHKYWLVFRLALLDVLEYRFDFLINSVKYTMMILMLALIWVAVGKENQNLPLSAAETIKYFFFAAMLYSLSNLHTDYIEEDIKLGYLSRFLVRPIAAMGYYFSLQASRSTTETAIKVVTMVPILFFLKLVPQVNVGSMTLFIIFLPFIYFFAFYMISTISALTFWINETWAIRWALTIIFRLLSGVLVPIVFFPENLQKIFFYLPFEHLAYTPIQLIQNKISLTTGITGLGILLSWSVVLYIFHTWVWNKGIRQYEGTGI